MEPGSAGLFCADCVEDQEDWRIGGSKRIGGLEDWRIGGLEDLGAGVSSDGLGRQPPNTEHRTPNTEHRMPTRSTKSKPSVPQCLRGESQPNTEHRTPNTRLLR